MSRVYKIEKPFALPEVKRKVRTAVYARVSTRTDEQLESLAAQKEYYENLVMNNPEWTLAGIYVDEGITGTSYKKREQFKAMIADCKAGKIDQIITKSLSRFARNTVDTIENIRLLKTLGIGIWFEKEKIWTLDGKGEFVLTLMAGFAQQEAQSLSENTTWGLRKRMAAGQYSVGYKSFLGYGRGFVIEEDGAYTVKLIFKLFLQGYSAFQIKEMLNKYEYRTASGRGKWCCAVVTAILQNEKYKGDCLLQKEFSDSFLTKHKKKNCGELEQYYVTDGHEAIIPRELFDYCQEVYSERHQFRYSGMTLMNSKIRCGKCGSIFGPKPIHSNDKYRHILWQCRNRFRQEQSCFNIHFRDSDVPTLWNETTKAVLNAYPEIKTSVFQIISQVVDDTNRVTKIKINIGDIAHVDITDWALLVKHLTVTGHSAEIELFGGRTVHTILRIGEKDVHKKRGAVAP